MHNTPPEELLTAEEVAAALKVHPETVRRWARDGRIPSIQLPAGRGGSSPRRFLLSDITDLPTTTI